MKTAKLIELQRKRIDLIEEARKAHDDFDFDAASAEEIKALDSSMGGLYRQIDRLDLDIREEEMNSKEASEIEARRPGSDGVASGTDDAGSNWLLGKRSMWQDQRGNPVKVLDKTDRMAERDSGLGFGDLVRAKITGARNDEEKRALSEGTDSAGGFTVPTPLAQNFIDKLRANSVAIRAGAQTVPMNSETLAIARLASDPAVAWRAENAAIADTDATFERVTFTAKSLAGKQVISRELAEDSINVGAMIENAFAQSMAVELDRAAIYGDGLSNAPTGVWNTAGINSVSMGTNGAALADYDKLLDAVFEIKNANAADPTAMIANPRTETALQKLKDLDNNPLTVPSTIGRIPLLSTTSAPIDETEGTATDASSIVFGDFSQLMLGMRTEIRIDIFDQPLASTGQLLVVAWLRADVQLAQPKSFCKLTGIIP